MNAITETLTWFPVSDRLPDSDTTVLLHRAGDAWSEPTCYGYLDDGIWYEQSGSPLDEDPDDTDSNPEFFTPTHWAHVPVGPTPATPTH